MFTLNKKLAELTECIFAHWFVGIFLEYPYLALGLSVAFIIFHWYDELSDQKSKLIWKIYLSLNPLRDKGLTVKLTPMNIIMSLH